MNHHLTELRLDLLARFAINRLAYPFAALITEVNLRHPLLVNCAVFRREGLFADAALAVCLLLCQA